MEGEDLNHNHHYAGAMYTNQGPNIQGSQTITTANFNYPGQEQRDPTRTPTLPSVDVEGARRFIDRYYTAFRRDPASLANDLYKDDSVLTFDGEMFQGSQSIVGKLSSVRQHQFQCSISSFEHQVLKCSGILVFVQGELQASGGPSAYRFSQVFHLMPISEGSFYISNDMFRSIPA